MGIGFIPEAPMFLRKFIAEQYRKKFISNCIAFDSPRLETEVYPDGVEVMSDIPYKESGLKENLLDYYIPSGYEMEHGGRKEAFFLIHGGALVYGNKELDKCFGLYLAKTSGIPVVNINYRLFPDTDLKGMISDIKDAMEHAFKDKGFNDLHMIGDSSGGYLSMLMSVFARDEGVRSNLGMELDPGITSSSCNMICASFKTDHRMLPGIYFGKKETLPPFVYDLTMLAERKTFPPCAFMTGDKDFLQKENREFKKLLDEKGIPCRFLDFESEGDRVMFHVFPVARPVWPESIKATEMFIENAKASV